MSWKYLVRNHAWPAIMGLGAAVVSAVSSGVPETIADGIQWPDDAVQLGGIAVAAGLAYLATLMTRYAGKTEDWLEPAKPA